MAPRQARACDTSLLGVNVSEEWQAYRNEIIFLVFPSLQDSVSERLRRWTRNPLGSARRGSNPIAVVYTRPISLLQILGAFCGISDHANGMWEVLYISVTPAAAVT